MIITRPRVVRNAQSIAAPSHPQTCSKTVARISCTEDFSTKLRAAPQSSRAEHLSSSVVNSSMSTGIAVSPAAKAAVYPANS